MFCELIVIFAFCLSGLVFTIALQNRLVLLLTGENMTLNLEDVQSYFIHCVITP